MSARLLRGFLALLIVSAYLSATVLPVAPIANAAPANMSHGMMHEPGGKMPCKGTVSGCVTEFGCILMVSLPAPELTVSAVVGWSPVSYVITGEFLRGRSTKPALGPPISRA